MLRVWIKRLLQPSEQPEIVDAAQLPPFYQLQAAMAHRVKTWRGLFWATVVVFGAVMVQQQRMIFHKLFQKTQEEIVIVPGSPEFFRVRPGQIPDQSVFLFAEYIAENLGNFSYRNVRYHLAKVTEHMAPAAKGRFEALFEKRMRDWQERKLDQTFAYEPVKRFDLVHDQSGAKYITAVTGTRTQYVEGKAFGESRDVLLVEFRPRGNLTPDKPFIFEVVSLEWLTPEQFEAIQSARANTAPKKDGD